MKHVLLPLLVLTGLLTVPGRADTFVEAWADDPVGTDAGKLTAWTLANGSSAAITVAETGGRRALSVSPETFAHLRTTQFLSAGNTLHLTGRLRLNPEVARAGVGLGVRTEKLGPPQGYEIRINPNLAQIFVFRVDGEQERQLLARPFPSDAESHDVKLTLDRSGAALAFTVSVDGNEVGSGTDAQPLDLGANVRPYLMSRGGTAVAFEKIELTAP